MEVPLASLSDAPEVEVTSRAELRAWLGANYAASRGVWLVTHKKSEGDRHLPYEAVVQECLAHGWVDSLPRTKDDRRSMLWISPRMPGSNWSRVNKAHVERLEAGGLMTPAGRAAVEAPRPTAPGPRSTGVEALEVPPDFAAALEGPLREVWEGWPRSVKRGALEILLNAKRPETRAAKIAAIREAAEKRERPFEWRGR